MLASLNQPLAQTVGRKEPLAAHGCLLVRVGKTALKCGARQNCGPCGLKTTACGVRQSGPGSPHQAKMNGTKDRPVTLVLPRSVHFEGRVLPTLIPAVPLQDSWSILCGAWCCRKAVSSNTRESPHCPGPVPNYHYIQGQPTPF